ncbi:hypothetical protein Ccrd_007145 [Cynara cardunculus var. scolymus]|uniref:Uncharacterized protein n=1 Tax=Cynara cardunculus var. scolymus TaxID=59895 RepID=A0A103XHN4_CYNCS|nr:hypothetical protein Ccrd_007145 [Cynara cardunculus var. scolymus]
MMIMRRSRTRFWSLSGGCQSSVAAELASKADASQFAGAQVEKVDCEFKLPFWFLLEDLLIIIREGEPSDWFGL